MDSLAHDQAQAALMMSLALRNGDDVGADYWHAAVERIGLAMDRAMSRAQVKERGVSRRSSSPSPVTRSSSATGTPPTTEPR